MQIKFQYRAKKNSYEIRYIYTNNTTNYTIDIGIHYLMKTIADHTNMNCK